MFKWYELAGVCYAFLQDVQELSDLRSSKWFTRGWTLQELIAPDDVRFYNKNWEFLGDRFGLAAEISSQTGIDLDVLTRGHLLNGGPWETHMLKKNEFCTTCGCQVESLHTILRRFCVAQKMVWASERVTTREEDVAYCLLGLFGINMTLIYGEGLEAFRRLQEEIIKRSYDQSILAWCDHISLRNEHSTFLAHHPQDFQLVYAQFKPPLYNIQRTRTSVLKAVNSEAERIEITASRLALTIVLCPLPSHTDANRLWAAANLHAAILDCVVGTDLKSRPAIILEKLSYNGTLFRRRGVGLVYKIEPPGRLICIANGGFGSVPLDGGKKSY